MMKVVLPDRRLLKITATALLLVDMLLLARRADQDRSLAWTAYMPELEQYQIEHPDSHLFNSERWDARIPRSSVIIPNEYSQPSMFRYFLSCNPTAVFVEWSQYPGALPIRFYLYGSNEQVAACAAKSLPTGYKLVSGDRVQIGKNNGS